MMRALHLDYIAKPVAANRVGAMILITAVVVGAFLVDRYTHFNSEKESWQAKWAQLQHDQKRKSGSTTLSSEALQQLKPEIKRANEVTQQLELPWEALFTAVEASYQEKVALLGIQPDAQKHTVSIAAEAKDLNSMLEYIKRLAQEPILADVHIINHQIQDQDPQKPVRFNVAAIWREPARK